MKKIIFAALFMAVFSGCKEDDTNVNPNLSAKEQVLKRYNESYLNSETNSVQFNDDENSCTVGSLSESVQNKVLARINYYRTEVGLPSVTFDAVLNAKAMEGALMIKSNNQLSHTPPTTWKCYSADGYESCNKGNIYLGRNTSNAIDGYIQDPGSGNKAVGHRRWILYSRGNKLGHGSTNKSSVLYVIGNTVPVPEDMPEFTSWPPKGYAIGRLIHPRWSISIPSANFDNAIVAMTGPIGESISLVQNDVYNGYGDNTLVWEPNGIANTIDGNEYSVSVSNVLVDGVAKSFDYKVTVVIP
jgi:uncharacterized protein YkwD